MPSKLRLLLGTRCFHFCAYHLIRIYSLTFRLRVENEQGWMDHLRGGGRVVLCAWHQQFFAAIGYFRVYREFEPAIMISKSSDGDIIADVAERSGWRAVRGSSSRGGKEALRKMIDHLRLTGLAGHILDGPRGPAGIVKAGVIELAHAADAVIAPFYTSADRTWRFNSWDGFLLPKPFARVMISFGETIELSPMEDEGAFERQRRELEKTMLPGLRAHPAGKSAHA
ncbi:MAG: lysophospholipid acyltransferase family protein [Pseudomonadota bacterium]|nr:lysophospholipid acyltransferase family protein [Pseudomonadota bacterium]